MRSSFIGRPGLAGVTLCALALTIFGCGGAGEMSSDAGSTGGSSVTGSGGHATVGSGGATGTGGGSGGTIQSGGTTGAGSGGSTGSGGASAGTAGMTESGGATGTGGREPGSGGVTPGSGGAAPGGSAGRMANGGAGGHAAGGAPGGSKGNAGGEAGSTSSGGGGGSGSTPKYCTTGGAATASTPTIYAIGDSTVSAYPSSDYPRMGWAQPLQEYFTPACAKVQDKALSGRSSKSFYDEKAWDPIKSALRPGDFVLIQFGHNDEKDDMPALYTDPQTTYKMYLSIYIDDTIAKGGTPILITPITRNYWSGGMVTDSHKGYPAAMRELAAAKHVALVDGDPLTMAYIMKIGQAAATQNVYLSGDSTHLQDKGAHTFAEIMLADMSRQRLPIASLLKAEVRAP